MDNFFPGYDIKLLTGNVFSNNFSDLKCLQEKKYAIKFYCT